MLKKFIFTDFKNTFNTSLVLDNINKNAKSIDRHVTNTKKHAMNTNKSAINTNRNVSRRAPRPYL